LLAHFFINIGRADVLGSGVRNLYRFTKIYSGGEPELIDGDVFKTIVPLSLPNGTMSDSEALDDKMSDNASDKAHREKILAHLAINGEISASEAAKIIERNPKTARRVLLELVSEGIVATMGANRNRKYEVKSK